MSDHNASDVKTIDGIIRASYAVISGPAGQQRDWDRFRSLFSPGARLLPVISGAEPRVRILTPEDYIRRVEPIFAKEDFWERETSRQAETIGRIAHVLSHYESLHDPDGAPFERGTNSIQLFNEHRKGRVEAFAVCGLPAGLPPLRYRHGQFSQQSQRFVPANARIRNALAISRSFAVD